MEERADGAVDFAVADTGPGIPEAQLAHIREPFHESSGAAGHRIGGVGLGLAIVHRYAALLGVQVDVALDGRRRHLLRRGGPVPRPRAATSAAS